MYDENGTYRIGINWKDVIVKVILIILFIILLLWLFPRNDLGVFYDSVYTNNINTMRDAAEKYYTGNRLPSTVGEAKVMTLKEMIDNKMIIRFTDKDKNYCDENASNVQVTKNATNDYVLKVHLVCGKDDDYILETLTGNGYGNGTSNGESNANNGTDSSNVKEASDKTANSSDSDNKESGSSTGKVAANSSDDVEVDYSGCTNVKDADTGNCAIYKTAVTMYQHRKAVYYTKNVCNCPAGFIQNGNSCIKVTKGATINGEPIYSGGQTITTDAKINSSGEITEYADPIKTRVGVDSKCPEGYTQNGAYCIKYTDATETTGGSKLVCEDGYNLRDNKCIKEYKATYDPGADKYTCPNGGDLKGTNCVVIKDASASTQTICPTGYTQNGSSCYKLIDAEEKTTTKCPAGSNQVGDKCYTGGTSSIDATPKTTYTCSSGSLSGTNCVSTSSIDATPKTTYTCSSGSLSGTNCVSTSTINATPKTTYTCSSGSLSGTSCVTTSTVNATPKTTYSCSSGSLSGSKCITTSTVNATPKTTYSCSSGSLSGSKCISTSTRDASASTEYTGWSFSQTVYYTSAGKAYTGDTSKRVYVGAISGSSCGSPCGNSGLWYKYSEYTRSKYTVYNCPSGYNRNGTKCTKQTSTNATPKTTYSCSSGYTLNGTKCTKKTTSNATPKTTYSCPAGYTLNGTKCTKSTSVGGTPKTTYSCPSGYTLNGTKCTKSTSTPGTPKTTYSCPSGYTLNGTKCITGGSKEVEPIIEKNYVCKEGVLEDKKCRITTKAEEKTVYSCPSGYTLNGTKCTWTYLATKEQGQGDYRCSNPEDTRSGEICTSTKEPTKVEGEKTYVCPEGKELSGDKCIERIPATTTDIYKYTCPEGYIQQGEGENTTCYKTVQKEGIYYCEDASAVLSGDKCIKNIEGQITGYRCPTGYNQEGAYCTKNTTETTGMVCTQKTTTSYKYIWSEKSYYEGWEFTGRTKTITKNYTAGQR